SQCENRYGSAACHQSHLSSSALRYASVRTMRRSRLSALSAASACVATAFHWCGSALGENALQLVEPLVDGDPALLLGGDVAGQLHLLVGQTIDVGFRRRHLRLYTGEDVVLVFLRHATAGLVVVREQ